MHIQTSDVPIKVNAPGAVARQQTEFGNTTGYGNIGAEHFKMDAGTDIAPLLQGLENDFCQAPHWGYLIKGDLTVTYTNGETEDAHAGDMFYWPPGHTVKVTQEHILTFLNRPTESNKPYNKRIRYSQLPSFFNFVRNNIDHEHRHPCDRPMNRKLYRERVPLRWKIIEKEALGRSFPAPPFTATATTAASSCSILSTFTTTSS